MYQVHLLDNSEMNQKHLRNLPQIAGKMILMFEFQQERFRNFSCIKRVRNLPKRKHKLSNFVCEVGQITAEVKSIFEKYFIKLSKP